MTQEQAEVPPPTLQQCAAAIGLPDSSGALTDFLMDIAREQVRRFRALEILLGDPPRLLVDGESPEFWWQQAILNQRFFARSVRYTTAESLRHGFRGLLETLARDVLLHLVAKAKPLERPVVRPGDIVCPVDKQVVLRAITPADMLVRIAKGMGFPNALVGPPVGRGPGRQSFAPKLCVFLMRDADGWKCQVGLAISWSLLQELCWWTVRPRSGEDVSACKS